LLGLLPFVLAGPVTLPRDANPGCSDHSFKNFQWAVQNFDFHASYIFSTPSHQNSWGYVNFTLENPALPYVAQCLASSDQLSDFFYGTLPYSCSFPQGTTHPAGTGAKFDFSRPSGELRINQTWQCSDVDPIYPTTFWARGAVNLTLDCTDTTWVNPNWTAGQIYSDREIKCQPVTVLVKPFEMTAVA
ncbi:hypothetical protein GQ53DRAFT_604249, partial [Thozetella sp. PMI_491]